MEFSRKEPIVMKRYLGNALKKAGLKKAALGVYFFLYNSRSEIIGAWRKRTIPGLIRSRSANGIYAVDLDSDWLGLGARMVKTLEIFLYCEERGLNPLIRYNYREKRQDKPDYFTELFTYKQADKRLLAEAKFTGIRDIHELGWGEDYNLKLRLDIAKPLFDKYLSINSEIEEEVGRFVTENFGGRKVLGVHYRGTDKAGEAPLVGKERLLGHIRDILKERPELELIFISTDDESIIQFLRQSQLPVPVLFREDAVRSNDGNQFHRRKEISKSIVHRDAIVNMILLSRCAFLLKTASILSDCSVMMNPSIAIKVISFPHSDELTWWPATEIRQNQENGKFALSERR
jgi:hypothetical protein